MKLTYIYHSGFVVESDNCTVCIDFFKDTEARTKGYIHNTILKEQKKLYVLSSHIHPDHFNREVLNWKTIRPDIRYVFSKDILEAGRANGSDAVFLNKGDVFQDDKIKIKAYGSTDVGISFLIELDGKTLFHAGDLNNWHWNEEVAEEESRQCERAYLNELNTLVNDYPEIDVVVFPVDPRLGKDYMLGAKQFLDYFSVGLFVPMHFGQNYKEAAAFRQYAIMKGANFVTWKEKGQSVWF